MKREKAAEGALPSLCDGGGAALSSPGPKSPEEEGGTREGQVKVCGCVGQMYMKEEEGDVWFFAIFGCSVHIFLVCVWEKWWRSDFFPT